MKDYVAKLLYYTYSLHRLFRTSMGPVKKFEVVNVLEDEKKPKSWFFMVLKMR